MHCATVLAGPLANADREGLLVCPMAMAEVCYLIYTSSMALSIKSDEADRLARELAAETGETLTDAVETALRERLDREHARHAASMRTRLARLAADVAALRSPMTGRRRRSSAMTTLACRVDRAEAQQPYR